MPGKRQSGFTLIELLLVAFLMGLVVAAVLLSTNLAGPEKRLEEAARKFSALTEMALDEAVLGSRDLGIVFDRDSYQFVELVDYRWRPVADALYKKRIIEEHSLDVTVEGFPWLADDSDFSARALFEDEDLLDEQNDKEKPLIPQVLLLSSGEVTAFELVIRSEGRLDNHSIRIKANALGAIAIEETPP